MKFRHRFRHWLAGKVLGPHSEDFEWGCDACREHEPVPPGPYDIALLTTLQKDYNDTLTRMLETAVPGEGSTNSRPR